MPRTARTPTAAGAAPRCDGFILSMEDDSPGPGPADAARDAVARAAAGDAGVPVQAWHAERLSEQSSDVFVRPANAGQPIPLPAAWRIARDLRAATGVADAEASLTAPGISPSPRSVPGAVAAKSFDDADPLPCSAETGWSLRFCRIPEAWELTPPTPEGRRFGEGIRVGHPDTGFTDHPQLDPVRVLAGDGWDYENGDPDAHDPLEGMHPGHGTSTASVIMSGIDPANSKGAVAGAAPGALLIPLRVSTSVIHLSFTKLTRAIHRCIEKDAHVVSMSLGGPIPSRALHRALVRLTDDGRIALAAAGNVWPWVVYPARYDEVVAVAACNCRDRPWKGSASGGDVDVTAPGESVWRATMSADWKADSGRGDGTSYAVATTAGVCALWLAYHGRDALVRKYGSRLAAVFRTLLMKRGIRRPPGWDTDDYGAGIVDADALLRAPLPPVPKHPAAPRTAAERQMEDLAGYFPGIDPGAVRDGAARLIGVSPRQLSQSLGRLGDELLFHVALNPVVRSRIALTPKGLTAKAGALRGSAAWKRTASAEFRASVRD